ncbi:MAG: hypothetical protein HY782_03205 [Chloroflexi bacterium]|nr:hypothetical protein [Chloroflexota bacterium]
MGIRTPQQYFDSLQDGRVVYCLGEQVKDVVNHPVLSICADWMAVDYALQQDLRYQDLHTEGTEHPIYSQLPEFPMRLSM